MGDTQAGQTSDFEEFFERFEEDLAALVKMGYVEVSDAGSLDALLQAHPELVRGYKHPVDGRIISFVMEESEGCCVVRAMVDGKELWSRRASSFPTKCYRLTQKGIDALAGAHGRRN